MTERTPAKPASSAPRPIDLNAVVRDRLEALRRIAHAEQALELDLAEGLPLVWAAPDRMGDVLVALVAAAGSSMSERGTIRIATRRFGEGDLAPVVGPRRVSLSVSAEGAVAPPPSARIAVEESRGTFESRGLPDGGSTCAVHLTAFPDALDPEPRTRSDQLRPGARRFGDFGPKDRAILLVEDDPAVRDILTVALARTGHHVVTASDGMAALQKMLEEDRAERPIAVLVTDVVMPRMGGYALAQHATAITPDLGVVFITGYRDQAAPPGADLLQKPFSPEALFRLVWEKLEAS